MGTTLFYFTGTGNSLYAARRIARKIGDAVVSPIAKEMRKAEILVDADLVGIVTPIYFCGWPAIVRDFLARAEFPAARYVFLVHTAGEPAMESVTTQARGALARMGLRLDASFGLKMIDSYLIKYGAFEEKARLSDAIEAGIERIAEAVRERRRVRYPRLPIPPAWFSEPWLAKAPSLDEGFAAGDSCNGCGTCVRICPVGNVALAEGRPVWSHGCQFCLACIHACPSASIAYGEATRGKGRYRNKNVSLGDLILS